MRLIITGGGTGGHLFPGLAVAREFRRRDPGTEILFVGTEGGLEQRVLSQEGLALEAVPIKGVKGRGLRGVLEVLYWLPVSCWRALGIIGRFRPDCIIGLGGYASAPLLLAGRLKRIPCAIMEQNLRPGLTNRILGRAAARVFTSFQESAGYFSRSTVVETGTPIRWQQLPHVEKDGEFVLLVFGGSAGAHSINLRVLEALGQLVSIASELRVVHQTGAADLERVSEGYAALPLQSEVRSFIDEMDQAYAQADLIVCRAGASTLAEITAFGKAAILIPYPYAADDHQTSNALALWDHGAAEVVLERDLTGPSLAERIDSLRRDGGRIESLRQEAKKLAKPDAARRIVDECYALVKA